MVLNYFKAICLILFLVWGKESFADNARLSDWMADQERLIQQRRLSDIFIPGSHDSATYRLEQKFGKNQDMTSKLNVLRYFLVGFAVTKIAEKWAKAQDLSIYDQLLNGVRYLDLRIIFRDSKKKFYTVHGLYGPSLDSILQQIARFLTEHPKEILIIQVGDLGYMPKGKNSHIDLVNQLRQSLGQWLVPNNSVALNKSIQELWKTNQRIVLIYNDSLVATEPDLFPRKFINSYWANSDNPRDLKTSLDGNLKNRGQQDGVFYVIQAQMTPGTETIKRSFKPFYRGYKSLKDMAVAVDREFPKWLADWSHFQPSIIMTDFCNAEKSRAIIGLNEQFVN